MFTVSLSHLLGVPLEILGNFESLQSLQIDNVSFFKDFQPHYPPPIRSKS